MIFTSLVRELPLAIAKDVDFENLLNDFANKKARKVFV